MTDDANARGVPPLGPGEVHVWRFGLDPEAPDLSRLEAALDADEIERAGRFRFGQLRSRFVAGRGTLRTILAAYLGVPPGSVAFDYGPHGKPALRPATGLEFNLSHSAARALLAIAQGAVVGVDLEEIDARRDVLGILGRFFADGERAEFAGLPEPDRLLAFYRGWSRKEAFLKAAGTGLSTALDSFEVTLAPEAPRLRRVGDDPAEAGRWSLRDLDAGPEFAAAVVVRGPITRLVVRDWPA